ncbi:hypothetical protein HRbin01_01189 [archaeon HR01]|nr:hypothetical protein HRbin01_01189 [archaeon HR01]
METIHKCPLCGEAVTWVERQTGLYACLYTCIKITPLPKHLATRHREYLEEAKKIAPPIFYSALFFAALSILYLVLWPSNLIVPGASLAGVGFFLILGWIMRVRLIRRHRLPGLNSS